MSGTPKYNRATLRRARELLLEGRELPHSYSITTLLAQSWQRSAQAGLTPEGRLPEVVWLDEHQLARAAECKMQLILHARPVLEFIHTQIRDSSSIVMLADDCGVILQAFGDADFFSRAQRVALKPGASWSEAHRGTNGIGTALAEGRPLAVHGGEHFLERNGFLSCAAAPVMAPNGTLLGAIDISGDERQNYSHTLGLVRAMAQTLENRLFESCHGHRLRLRFHTQAEGIGTFAEGAVALSEDGWIIGANSSAFPLLGLTAADLGVTPVSRILQIRFEDLLELSHRHLEEPLLVTLNHGNRIFVRIEAARTSSVAQNSAPTTPKDALAGIDFGDETMAAVVNKARKLIGKPIAVLLQGESGTGKAFFAQALHACGPRHAGPFVRVNCSAIQENLLVAELFGHIPPLGGGEWPGRLREAHGGTLFIEEIGDLPLQLQTLLLDVLQRKQLTPLGGEPKAIDFVLICATQYNLKQEVEAGRFRADLYYHISGMTLRCPPLRERKDFVLLLARRIEELSQGRNLSLEPALASAFASYHWPGNLNQLTNVLRAACALLNPDETRIGWQHLPDDLVEELRWPTPPPLAAGSEVAENLRDISAATISRAISLSHGNMSEAARRLGISRNTLYRHLRASKK